MLKKSGTPDRKRRKVTFVLSSPDAKAVSLMGDFNGWNEKKHPMKRDSNGVWIKSTMLFPGRYEYKFLVDSIWQEDRTNNQTCINGFGTSNNVIVVS